MKLPNDKARCNGVGSDAEGWREGCQDCLRRIAPRPDVFWFQLPPDVVPCELRIGEDDGTN